MRRFRLLPLVVLLLLECHISFAEVVRVEIQRRDDAGTHERIIGRVFFRVDPKLPANRGITDLEFAQNNKDGMVEFSSDLLFFRPKDARQARGTVFLEVVNRGRDQSLALMSGAQSARPLSGIVGSRRWLSSRTGFYGRFPRMAIRRATISRSHLSTRQTADVEGVVRDSHIQVAPATHRRLPARLLRAGRTERCKGDVSDAESMTPQCSPRNSWDFTTDGCSFGCAGISRPAFTRRFTTRKVRLSRALALRRCVILPPI